jgi:hypothetical protein
MAQIVTGINYGIREKLERKIFTTRFASTSAKATADRGGRRGGGGQNEPSFKMRKA